jgi:hypothetical protein
VSIADSSTVASNGPLGATGRYVLPDAFLARAAELYSAGPEGELDDGLVLTSMAADGRPTYAAVLDGEAFDVSSPEGHAAALLHPVLSR